MISPKTIEKYVHDLKHTWPIIHNFTVSRSITACATFVLINLSLLSKVNSTYCIKIS